MMALSPVVYIPPGCSQYCTRSVIARPNNNTFAYASDKSITLYTKVNYSIPNFTKSSVVEELNNNAANGCQGGSLNINNNNSSNGSSTTPTQTKGSVLTTSAYELTCTYGDNIHGDIICFDYNDECMACITAQTHEVYMWKLINAESITQSKISPSLTSTFTKEGKPTTMVLVGKHHIIFGTSHGKLISLNTNEHHEPRVVAIPFTDSNSSSDNSNNKTLPTRAPSTSQLLSGGNTTTLTSTSFTSTSPLTAGTTATTIGGTMNTINNPPNLPIPSFITPHISSNSPERHTSNNTTHVLNSPLGNSLKSSPLPQTPSPAAEQQINMNSVNNLNVDVDALRVTCVAVSPLRADTIVAGTANGSVVFCSLSASAGLRITSTLQPFSSINKFSTSIENNSFPVSLVCFSPHTAQHVLVGSVYGALALCDSSSNTIITYFDYKECGMLRGIAWSLEENGVFYTINGQSNKIDKWNVNNAQKISSFAPVSPTYCVVNMSFVEKDKLLIALHDGSVRVVSMTVNSQAKENTSSEINIISNSNNKISCQTEFSTSSNHTSHIRNCVLSRFDKDLMATSGGEHDNNNNNINTIQVWNLRQMKVIYSIEVGDVVVTSLAWAPNGKYVAVGLHSGEVVIYHCNSQKEVRRHLIFTDALHQLVWLPSEQEEKEEIKEEELSGSMIAASRYAGVALLNLKESRIIQRWTLPAINIASSTHSLPPHLVNANTISDQITCMDVQSMQGKHFAVGCESGKVHLFRLGSTQSSPSLSWSTYGGAITSLAFCPVANQFVLIGSADGTVRLYDISLSEPRLITSNVREFALHNMSNDGSSSKAVSCVAWCSLAPYLILSSSQGGFVYIWDIRTSLCIYSIRGHTSQINCLLSHEERPLIFISAGEDGAIMAWSLTLLRQMELEAAMGTLESNFVPDASSLIMLPAVNTTLAVTSSHPHKELSLSSVTGVAVQKLLQELRETNSLNTTSTINRVEKIVNFFDFPHGAMDLASFVPYATDAKTFNASTNSESGKSVIMYPASKLADLYKNKVNEMKESVQGAMAASTFMQDAEKDKIVQVAYAMMKVGQLEECCRLLMEVKEYDKALAIAPMVSMSYWKELCKKVAIALEDDGDERAVQYYVACEESVKAAQLLARNAPSQINEAIVLCETCIQNTNTVTTSNNNANSSSVTPSPESTEEKPISSGHGKKKTKDKESRRSTSIRTEAVPIIPPVPMATSLNLPKTELAGLSISANTVPNITNTTHPSKSKSRENVNENDTSKDDVNNTSSNTINNLTRKRLSGTKALSHARKGLLIQRAMYIAQTYHVSNRLIAAALLTSGAHDTCVQMLQNNGDVVLSYLLVHAIPIRAQCSIDVAYWQAMLQSAHMHKWESALKCAIRYSNQYHSLATLCAYYQYAHIKMISNVEGSNSITNKGGNQEHQTNKASRMKTNNDKVATFMKLIRQECTQLQLPLDAASIQQRHASDGLASQNQLAAMILTMDLTNFTTTTTNAKSNTIHDSLGSSIPIMTSPVLLQSASGFMESLLSAALQDIDSVNAQFYLRQALNVSSYISLPVVLGNETSGENNNNKKTSTLSSSVPLSLTTSESANFTSSVGNGLSLDQRKFLALALTTASLFCVKIYRFPKLLNPTFGKAREMANGHASVEALLTKLQTQLATYSPHSIEVECNCTGAHIPLIDAHGKLYTSVLTNEPIRGPLFVLEDGISYTSREEMLQWTMCCHFSPLLTGARVVVL